MVSSYKLTYKQFGERAILIEWPAIIQETILYDIIQFKNTILQHSSEDIEDCIVGYHSLTIKYHSFLRDYKYTRSLLVELYATDYQKTGLSAYLWELPVCYDIQFGIDLEEMSKKTGLSIKDIVDIHTSATYTVYFIGFLPGFLYLGGLDDRLHLARRATPRLLVDEGAVGIGGHQTGIYPMQSAGGWNIIGNTPVPLFDLKADMPCFAKAGDKIKFSPVSIEAHTRIGKRIAQGTYELSKTLLHA